MRSGNNPDFAPDRTNFVEFSAVCSDSFFLNHFSHDFLFKSFKFFRNKVNTGFCHHDFCFVVIAVRIKFRFDHIFSFFKFRFSAFSVKVVISFCNFVISYVIYNFCNCRCIIRVYKFGFYNTAIVHKLNLQFALASDFYLSKFNSLHNIIFCNKFCACFNHNYRIVSTCYNNVYI